MKKFEILLVFCIMNEQCINSLVFTRKIVRLQGCPQCQYVLFVYVWYVCFLNFVYYVHMYHVTEREK